jgi:hypothetical protein
MAATDLIVEKQNIGNVQLIESPLTSREPAVGQIKLAIDQFGMTSNNLSYAAAGDVLGYWSFFPTADPAWGIVPAWGFATVIESKHPDVAVGEEIFGFVPMARHLILEPHDVGGVSFSDRFEHRAGLHPWYNRYYRTTGDPASAPESRHLQPVFWALYMTGWMLAAHFEANTDFGADRVLVASASSKTAVSFAASMKARTPAAGRSTELVGLTSNANAAFVESLGCYDHVRTYDDLELDQLGGTAALVDMSGNADVVSSVHNTFADRLVQSIIVGSTHLSARGETAGLPGPDRRFFFIPDVAEARSAELGQAEYHGSFAAAWSTFAAWADGFTTITESTGPQAIEDAFLRALAGNHDPSAGTILRYA